MLVEGWTDVPDDCRPYNPDNNKQTYADGLNHNIMLLAVITRLNRSRGD